MPTQPSYSRNVLGLIESMLNADVGGRADIYQVYSTVCRIRGLPCNLHNQYSIVSPVPAVVTSANSAMAISPSIVNNDLLNPNANQQYLQPLAGGGLSINPLSSLGSNSIAPSPTVSPMRRGRPPKHSKTPSSGSLNADGVSTPPILNVDLMNSPHNPFNTDSRPARSNRLTAPPDFFATADFNNNSVSQDVIPHGLPTNTSSHRLTAPPSFFTNVQTMDVTGLGTYSLSNGGQAYPSRRTSSSSGPMQVPFESQSFNIPTFTALPSNPQFPAESSAPQPQFPQSHQQAFAQQGPDPFDPFGAQIRRDSTRSIPNLKVAVNATPTPTPIPPHLISPRSFTKSTSEVRLNALGDSSVRMHGHSRNKSWAQTHTAAHGQYQPKPPTSASAHHSRNASKDSFDSASTGSSAGVNVAGLVRQFQQSATIGEQQGMDSAFSSAASTHVQQPSMQYSRHSSVSGPSSPGFLSPNRPGSGSIGINLPPSGTLPNHIQAHQNAPPPKPPRNLELPPAHTPMAVFPSAMPSPMTPLPPSVMFDPFTVPSSAWVQMNSGQSDLHGGRGNSWDAFNLNPGSIAQPHQQPQPQQPQHQPRSQPLRSDVSADRKADEFLRGLMER
ncbi:hypothetical protein DFJ77DRAFT_450605 [Powellomyces hirtus]|nr:hypothetical protein DFJ77DRAFT_450605 [Powellomyces hirtus]